MKDIDQITVEMARSADLSKALPPKVKYRFQQWLKRLNPKTPDIQSERRKVIDTAKSELADRINEMKARKNLAKNEAMVSAFDDGAIKFDFGSEVPDDIKKAAFTWAKKRGLQAVEASLVKSVDAVETVMFSGENSNPLRSCSKRVKWVLD